MKIIEQSHEILHMDGLDLIERAGRTCYKSEEQAHTCKAGDAVLAHCKLLGSKDGTQCYAGDCGHNSAFKFIRMLIKRGHEAMLEHGKAAVRLETNRGVGYEFIRHRPTSEDQNPADFQHIDPALAQESTRYVNYGGKEMEFIRPVWCDGPSEAYGFWADAMWAAEDHYKQLLFLGWQPQQAREVLPNSLKTEIVVTANYREWRHIFKLRALGTTGKPHPQMQALMMPVLEDFKAKLPALFGDMGV